MKRVLWLPPSAAALLALAFGVGAVWSHPLWVLPCLGFYFACVLSADHAAGGGG